MIAISESKELFIQQIEKPMVGLLKLYSLFPSLKVPAEDFFQISDRIMVINFFS
jgi:hypothetical protein